MKNVLKRLWRIIAEFARCLAVVVLWPVKMVAIVMGTMLCVVLVAPVCYIISGKDIIESWFDLLDDESEWWSKFMD